jgi:hypothetical protein
MPEDTSPPSKEGPPSALAHSLNDAEILANYAVRNNIVGVHEAITGIAKAREDFVAGKLKGDEQRQFYAAYSTLASAIAPVTVSSLKDSLDEYGVEVRDWFHLGRKRMLSQAGLAAYRQSLLATLVLLALVVAQSYWLIGNAFISEAPPQTPEERAALLSAGLAAVPTGNANQIPTSQGAEKSPDDKLAAEKVQFEAATTLHHRAEITRLLVNWAWYLGLGQTSDPDKVYTVCRRILDILQQYVLPLLYGMLGAMAYVIRSISQQARDRLYRQENETGYYLRVWLVSSAA